MLSGYQMLPGGMAPDPLAARAEDQREPRDPIRSSWDPLDRCEPGLAEAAGTEPHAWETGLMDTLTYIGLDVQKATVSVAVAESARRRDPPNRGFREPSRGSREAGGAGE
jgi:hypothetical protein